MSGREGNHASDTWADQLGFPPFIADEGGEVLYNQAFYDARRRLANRDAVSGAVALIPFHSSMASAEEARNHGDQ